ncbi:S9 family peptidase [Pollutimonas harenae]|uniref:S9 family peptidase n=1 Tax=Pollutimonas harenae TaxID=657015 RepID=A0A853H0M8_9BURK|nr:prolyl oligopeptidase family serine peptidase [Pollutimonas harenae]NYT85882.1 S9 family peptidase [Pollutimonas harenae]TEA70938.1 S9 family peptidase [Pollutimonas harenae]
MHSTSSSGPTALWPDSVPPIPPREDHKIHQLGRERVDHYAWMKFIPSSCSRTLDGLPERLRQHLDAEMEYARDVLHPLAADAKYFYEQMVQRASGSNDALPASAQRWRYDCTVPDGHAHRVFSRIRPDGVTQELFDEAERARGYAYYRATDHQPSPDDRYFVWAEDVSGDDRHRICVLDTDSGLISTVVQADAFGYGGFTLCPSSRHLFWIWRDACNRPTRLYRSPVEGGEAVLVYEEHDPAIFMQIARTAGNGFVALTLAGPDMSEVYLIAAGSETVAPRLVRLRQRGIRYEINEWNNTLLMLTNADGSVDRKLVEIDAVNFDVCREWVPHRAGTSIISIHPFAYALLRLERVNSLRRLVLMRADGTEVVVDFDEPAYTIELAPSQSYDARQVRIVHQTLNSPPRWLDIDLADGQCRVVGQTHLSGFDPSAYRLERLYARASDGASIPITILSPADAPEDKPLPLLLTGYGAYGISYEPRFSLPATVLVANGFRYAIAHVRGGSEKGWRWYQDGCREKKRNSMTDFIACAQHLQNIGYTAPGKIVAHGVSAGGLLVCGAMNIDPQQWAGVIAQVPFVDMLNTMSNADHPLVPLLRPDWGDPISDPQAYDYIAGISPYENIKQAAYPPVLCTAGLKDDRVPYWEPAKLVASLRHHSTSHYPAVLRLNPDSGHQESDDQYAEFAQAALLWAFARHCVSANEA